MPGLAVPERDGGAAGLSSLLAGQGADLDQVVGEDPVPAPDGGTFFTVQVGAVPPVGVLEIADPALGTGAPLDEFAEARAVLGGLAAG